jgi:UPF0716 protein FxsA
MWLFVAFLMVPLIEIALFIQVGGLIGLWPTLAVVVVTAILGTWMVKAQGRLALNNLRQSFNRLEDPGEPLAHGAMILLSGALLLTPGFFTDGVGFALLVPAVRVAVFRWLKARVSVTSFQMGGEAMHPRAETGRGAAAPQDRARPEVIDGDYTEVTRDKKPNHPGSGWTRH